MLSYESAGSEKQGWFPPALSHLSHPPPHSLASVKFPGEKRNIKYDMVIKQYI